MKPTDWASVVYARNPRNEVVLILDPKKPLPHGWKFPGGGKKRFETPEKTAARELEEETGLIVNADDLFPVGHVDKKNHTLFLFYVAVPDFDGLKEYGNEGEWVDTFDAHDLLHMKDFLPDHRPFLHYIKMHETELSQHTPPTKDVSIPLRPR